MSEDVPRYLTLEQELNALDLRKAVMTDPSASNWLKRAVVDLWDRDVIDALNDLEVLRAVLEAKHQTSVLTLKRMVTSDDGTRH